MSLGVTPGASAPSKNTRMRCGLRSTSGWVASTWPSSDAPMPKASAPMPPCVQVWLSPQTSVVPGSVRPCSGPTTWTMPLPSLPMSNSRMPVLAALARRSRSSGAPGAKVSSVRPGIVEIAWSGVAAIRFG